MKAYQLCDTFGLDQLKLVDLPDPEPGPGEIVVDIKATSLNYRDVMVAQGIYNPKQPLPLTPCSDGAGVVSAIGEGVTRVAVGDRVASCFFQGWLSGAPIPVKCYETSLGSPLQGCLADKVLLRAEGCVKLPDSMSFAEGATLPCAALTAWNALRCLGNLQEGQIVLTLGTGGVSLFALQIAQLVGARVIVTSGSDEKLERAKALGACHGVNYNTHPDWATEVKKLTGGCGVDHVIEVGGAGTLEQSMKSVRMGGCVSVIGVLAGVVEPLNILPILMSQIRLQGVFVGHREAFEDMLKEFSNNELRPIIGERFDFSEAPRAFACMAEARHFGKIVLT